MKKAFNTENFKKVVYSVTALALCGVTLFAFNMQNRDNEDISSQNSDLHTEAEPSEERITDEIEVNNPVENIPDDRFTEPLTQQPTDVYYAYPFEGSVIKAYSGENLVKNSTTEDWRTHGGIDIGGSAGGRVNAICDGTVTHLEHNALWGTVLTIDHGNGITARYCGLEKGSTLTPGDEVKINEKIGVLGEIPIEKADGIHLHIEISRDGKAVSPALYLGKRVDI